MDKSINEFIRSAKEEGLTEVTINKYVSDIKQFHKFIKLKLDKNFKELSQEEVKEQLESYIKSLEKRQYKPSTINGKIVIINKYLKVLGIECIHKYLKVQKKIYVENVLTEGEYKRIIEQCNNKRDELIIQMLVNTGVRVSELLSLTIQDINRKEIYIKGKGSKYREIIISPQLRQKIREYIKEYRLDTDKEKLFTGKRGALKRDAVNKMLLKYAKKAHVRKEKAHPHSCRHLFGKRLADKGISLDIIQTCLGHESIATTAIYTKRSKEELERTLENNFI
ncbi:tyrosine-type recombinase/integrase [Clostridium neonatale]|uniref:Integrase/recombinase XerD n=1 Tax=Clostridium neonatale TaxID=137838 RepID=A0AAD1YJT9_9CLOT|nr:tyrosine-type recombinase/integrase [Clostridium neonatale]MBP8312809.1 tyrosine-type recombinase/integrase [Clostridium neonatale]CAI3195266.1 integrase/recombinase XerD [Clostridium neonatale]CAI3214070.1 integrase/recombinase XerD [Clostridium neonatale]CAI3216176.1 integrase/recombinase XerD [Clostridium neonatale]CAI3216697.1 integrase/recombinase XerD [Clostridium neonatale]